MYRQRSMRFALAILTTVVMTGVAFAGEPLQAVAGTTVTSTISIGFRPQGVACDAGNGDVYVANYNANTVSVMVPPLPTITNSSVGTTAVIAKLNTPGDTFAVQVNSTPPRLGPGTSLPSGTVTYTSGTNISNAAVGDVVTLYEISSGGTVDAATSITLGATFAPPAPTSEYLTVDGNAHQVIGNCGYNPATAIEEGNYFGYAEERAALKAEADFTGEGIKSAYLTAILSGEGVGYEYENYVTDLRQGQFAPLYQKLGIIPPRGTELT